MEINIKNLIGKLEIHHHSNEPQEVVGLEDAISEILGNAVADISQVPILQDDTQNKAQSLFCKQDFEKEVSEAQPSSSLLPSYKLESKSIMLANTLRQNYAPLDRVVQLLLTQETSRTPQRKKHGESLESCLLHQTANLLHILSAYVIPHLERLNDNKTQHS